MLAHPIPRPRPCTSGAPSAAFLHRARVPGAVRLVPTKVQYTGFNVFLYADNPEKSAEWYKALGFKLDRVHDLPGGLKVFAFDINGRSLVIGPPAPFEPQRTLDWLRAKPWGTGTVLMPATKSVDAVFERAKEIGAEVVEPPADQAWGSRTVVLRDPDGYWLMFDQPLTPPRQRAKARAKARTTKAKGAGKAKGAKRGR